MPIGEDSPYLSVLGYTLNKYAKGEVQVIINSAFDVLVKVTFRTLLSAVRNSSVF